MATNFVAKFAKLVYSTFVWHNGVSKQFAGSQFDLKDCMTMIPLYCIWIW